MILKKSVFFIPYWIEDAVKQNGLTLAECLDFTKIKPICSLNDLIGFSALQKYSTTILGKDIYDPVSAYEFFMKWATSIGEDNPAMHDYLTKNIASLDEDEAFRKELELRLLTPESKQARFTEPFAVHDLTRDMVGVVIYPGFFGDTSSTQAQFDLIEAVLKVLYVYNSHSEVSTTSLFLRYLELLSKK